MQDGLHGTRLKGTNKFLCNMDADPLSRHSKGNLHTSLRDFRLSDAVGPET